MTTNYKPVYLFVAFEKETGEAELSLLYCIILYLIR